MDNPVSWYRPTEAAWKLVGQPVSDCGRSALRARDVRCAGDADTERLGGWDEFGGSAAGTEREDWRAGMTNRRMRRSEDRG